MKNHQDDFLWIHWCVFNLRRYRNRKNFLAVYAIAYGERDSFAMFDAAHFAARHIGRAVRNLCIYIGI